MRRTGSYSSTPRGQQAQIEMAGLVGGVASKRVTASAWREARGERARRRRWVPCQIAWSVECGCGCASERGTEGGRERGRGERTKSKQQVSRKDCNAASIVNMESEIMQF